MIPLTMGAFLKRRTRYAIARGFVLVVALSILAPKLAHGDDFHDGASGAAGEDGVGCFAESLQFGQRPRRSATAFDSFFCRARHGLIQELAVLAANDRCAMASACGESPMIHSQGLK